jgi:nucleoside phosphorylase/bifunctional DNase/RNase
VGQENELVTHVFISYGHRDAAAVDHVQHQFESAGLQVWRDTADLWPGQDRRARIRQAITSNALVFVACFSASSLAHLSGSQNEEFTLAIEEFRRRPAAVPWIIPVRFDACEIPDLELGGGRNLRSIQRADLFGADATRHLERLVTVIRELASGHQAPPSAPGPPPSSSGTFGTVTLDATAPTLGIVTALHQEFAAMRSFLGGSRRVNVTGDRADYFSGTLPSSEQGHPHQVVLTILGEPGNDAAANACANLLRSFPNVRCVLMVGIAAGVPSPGRPERHVRLGDIVVARWGIVEYDSVRDDDAGPVPRRSFPPPSPLLERRAKLLEADENIGIWRLDELLTAKAHVLPGYERPAEATDVLYASDGSTDRIPHPPITLTGHRPGRPKVHCGLIASGDRSLRSASKRDSIAASQGVLAIEMEGKGIGNSGFYQGVEWFTIRGISDYGDSHVTPLWRKYASLVAAAYATVLLGQTPPLPGERPSQADQGRGADRAPGNASRELDVLGTRSSQSLRLPVVDLLDRQAGVFLTLRVSQAEAVSIAYAKEGISAGSDQEHSASYVLPHDLLVGALDAIGVPMLSGEIRGAPNRTLIARLMLAGERMVTCTPADAIALALRARTPLIAPAGLLDQASTGIPGQHDDQTWLGSAARFDQTAVRAPAALISPAPGTVAVSVTGIGAGAEADEPAVLLKAAPDGWTAPVCVSPIEAVAVDAARRGELSRCPSAHVLFHDLLSKAGAALVAALITGRSDAGAVAELTFSSGQRMPARVGDALTVALLTGANIFASVDLSDAVPLLD